jgi:hypothetical protein
VSLIWSWQALTFVWQRVGGEDHVGAVVVGGHDDALDHCPGLFGLGEYQRAAAARDHLLEGRDGVGALGVDVLVEALWLIEGLAVDAEGAVGLAPGWSGLPASAVSFR